MARIFRFYEKKRGHRRTGSRKLGSAGDALFRAALFFLGCAGMAVLFETLVIPEWQANNQFVSGGCTVLGVHVGEQKGEDGQLYRAEVQIKYEVDGQTHVIWTYDIHTLRGNGYTPNRDEVLATLKPFCDSLERDAPARYKCWYDPTEPDRAVLVRGSRWWIWLTFIVPVSFILLGGGGLVYAVAMWGKSTERRAAILQRTASLDPFDRGEGKEFPGIPPGARLTDSPGAWLAFRLPVATSARWAVIGSLLGCLFWNGAVAILLTMVTARHWSGEPDWFLTFFTLFAAAAGVGLIGYFLRQLLLATGIGPTLVEISDQPLFPGEQYRLFLSQSGRIKVNSLEIMLVCEEEATFRQGTDSRTETRRVYRQPLFRREEFEIRQGAPFEVGCEIDVPRGAMHSFRSDHNEINWKVVVAVSAAARPKFERSFPVIVFPSPNESVRQ